MIKTLLEDSRVEFASKKLGLPVEQVEELRKFDPTPSGSYLLWIAKQAKLGNLVFPEDGQKTLETLAAFEALKKKSTFTGEKDISRYEDFGGLWDVVDAARGVMGKKERVRRAAEEGARVLFGDWKNGVVEVTTPEAGAKLFRGTAWCVKDPAYFTSYKPSVYHMFLLNGKEVALLHRESRQFKKRSDTQISIKEAIPLKDLLAGSGLLPSEREAKIGIATDTGNRVLNTLSLLINDKDRLIDQLFPSGMAWSLSLKSFKRMGEELWNNEFMQKVGAGAVSEKVVAVARMAKYSSAAKEYAKANPEVAYYYAKDIIKGPWPEGEEAIAKDPSFAYSYAREVIEGRWPEGEATIASSPSLACYYAEDVIKGPWPEGEEAIARDSRSAYHYARDVIKGPWPEGEEAIAKDPSWSCCYAKDIIKGPWPEGEEAIARDSRSAYYYARDVAGGRWPEGEAAIAKDPYFAYYYVRDVIKGRWPEGEAAIAKIPAWDNYSAEYLS